MSYRVRIHPAAERDYRDQFAYIAERSPDGAQRWEAAFESLVDRIAKNPLLFGHAYEAPRLRRELRSATFGTKHGNTYVAVYLMDGENVTILRIRGEGQPPLTLGDLPD